MVNRPILCVCNFSCFGSLSLGLMLVSRDGANRGSERERHEHTKFRMFPTARPCVCLPVSRATSKWY